MLRSRLRVVEARMEAGRELFLARNRSLSTNGIYPRRFLFRPARHVHNPRLTLLKPRFLTERRLNGNAESKRGPGDDGGQLGKKPRGRPKGSKNRAKIPSAPDSSAPPDI